MEAFSYIIVSFIALVLSFFLFKKASGSMALTQLNMLSYLFYVPLVLMSFIGGLFIVLNLDDHYLINKLQDSNTRIIGWLAILYTMVMLPIGMLLSKKIFLKQDTKHYLKRYAAKPIKYMLGEHELILKSSLFVLSGIGILTLLYTFYSIGTIPIIQLLSGNAEELARLRISASREFGGNVYIRNIFALQFLPLLSFIAFAYYQKSKSILDFTWFLVTFVSALLILSYDLQKSPMAMFLTGFLFYVVWTKGQIALHKFAIIGLVFAGTIILFYVGFGNTDIVGILFQYNEGASGRILFSQIAGTFFSFEFFDNLKNFIGFNSISTFVNNFGLEYSERAGRLIMEIINPKGVQAGTVGVQNTLFIGEAWANFGFLGLLLSPLYVGFIIGSLFYGLMRLPKSPIFIGIYVFFSYKTALIGGFNDYIYNITILAILIVFGFALLHAYRVSASIKSNA